MLSSSTPKMARVATTAVNSEISTPIPSVKAKPFGPAVANMNTMIAVARVTTLASMIAAIPRRYPADSAAAGSCPPGFLAHAFEDHHVGVRRDTDGEDYAGDARQASA